MTLDVDSHGRVYVADFGIHGIVVLGSNGDPLDTIGRGGAGPGEFASLLGLQVLPGDSVLASDPSLARVTIFSPGEHRVVRTISTMPANGGIATTVLSVPPLTSFFAMFEQPYIAGRPRESDSSRVTVFGVLDSAGRVVAESILAVPSSQQLVARSGDAVAARDSPFGGEVIPHVAAGTLWYVLTTQPIVHAIDLRGRVQRTITLPFPSVPLARSVVDDSADHVEEMFRATLRRTAPKFWPVLRDFAVDQHGGFWVGVATDPGRRVTWVAIDSTDREWKRIEMPWNVSLKAVRGDTLYAVELDEDDVPRVLILRLAKGAG